MLAQRPRAAACRAAGQRLAALLVEVAPLGPGPLAGHVRLVGRAPRRSLVVVAHGGGVATSGLRRFAGPRLAWLGVGLVEDQLVDVGRAAGRRFARDADRSPVTFLEAACRPPGDRPVAPRSDAGTRARRPTRRRRSGSRRSRRGCPAIRPPMRTEPRTTIGWMPTAPCMIRGWRTFMTTNQPAPIRISAGSADSGWRTRATTTGGAHETNGPKNGIIWSSRRAPRSGRPAAGREQVRAERDQEVDRAHQGLAAQEAAERARDRRLEQARLLRSRPAARCRNRKARMSSRSRTM